MNTATYTGVEPEALEMETKVLQHNNARLAVRLEKLYWRQLEELAAAEEQGLSSHVHALLAALPRRQNRASFLRSHCLHKLRSRLDQFTAMRGETNLGEIISACPCPVFVVSAERKILVFNSVFMSSVLDMLKDKSGAKPSSPRLTFSQPFRNIVSYLVSNRNKVVSGQVGFMSDTKSLQRQVRFALLDRALGENSPVVVFVEDK